MTRLLKSTAQFLTLRTSFNAAFGFRPWAVFGFVVAIPTFALTAKLCKDRTELLRAARHELATCPRCHRLLSVKAANSFIRHLQDDHKIEANDSYALVADVYRRMLIAHELRDARREKAISA